MRQILISYALWQYPKICAKIGKTALPTVSDTRASDTQDRQSHATSPVGLHHKQLQIINSLSLNLHN